MADTDKTEYENHVRALLAAIRSGDRAAFDVLIGAIGHEMRRLSAFQLRQRPPAQTLQTTALVHEAVLRLIQMLDRNREGFPQTKEHLMALIAKMMRYTLADYGRRRKLTFVTIDSPRPDDEGGRPLADEAVLEQWSEPEIDALIAVDEALTTIERSDPDYGARRSAAIELYLFGGLNYREIADELGVTDDMARRDCQIALSRLRALLSGEAGSASPMNA